MMVSVLPLVSASTSAAAPLVSEYPVPSQNAFLIDITAGPDGNLWFTESATSKIGRITPAGTVTEYPTPTEFAGPASITAGPPGDGNVWFVEQAAGNVAKVTSDGAITEFAIPTPGSQPRGIVAGPDGNLWFTEGGPDKIGRITPGGSIVEFGLPAGSNPEGITSGADGNLWFTMSGTNRIGRITPSGTITGFPLPSAGSQPKSIVAGPDGNLWFTMRGAPKIGRMTPTGTVTEFLLPSRGVALASDFASDIAVGVDGALWYSRPQANAVGRITTDGVIGELVLPTPNSFPTAITAGPDGRIWMVLEGTNAIGAVETTRLPLARPEVRIVSPATGSPAGGTQVTFTGVNLLDATAVTFGDTSATSFSTVPGDAGTLLVIAPAHALGRVDVKVATPRGATTASLASRFFYTDPGCGQVITTNTTLTADIGPCSGNGVIIGADNVTLDLNGKRIFGFPGHSGGTAAGIRLPSRTGVVIKGPGTVSGFDAGVFLNEGRANTLTNLNIRDNIGPDTVFGVELGDGIALFNSADNRIVHNTVVHNGVYDGIAVLGKGSSGNRVANNLVANNIGPSDGGPAGQGIIVNAYLDFGELGVTVVGNDVVSNVVRNNGSAGISLNSNRDATVQSNIVEDNGKFNENGNGIGVQDGPSATDPIIFPNLVKNNQVRANGDNGIIVASMNNRIIDNTSIDNNTKNLDAYDLRDNLNCSNNVWRRNTWGSAGYFPPCVTVGGSGPAPATSVATAAAAASRDPVPLVRRSPSQP